MKKGKTKKQFLNVVYNKDSRTIAETIPNGVKVRTTITSPPYFDMKDYGGEDQIGFGQTYDQYLEDLKLIFQGVFDITEEDGTLWIVIDSFKRNNQVVTLPFDLSNKLKEIGWLLQDVIIWKKDKTVPWSSNGFMQRKFEYILFFSKNSKFKTNKDTVRVFDTSQLKKWWVKYPERYNPKGKALDEVWEFPIPTQGSWGDEYIRHFCPLPKEMVATMIQISSDEHDTILDPFAGSGTVLSQSAYMKRNYIGFELNSGYIDMFQKYFEKTFELQRKEYDLLNDRIDQDLFETQILDLRALKYARILVSEVQKELNNKEFKIFVEKKGKSTLKNKILNVNYEFIGRLDNTAVLQIVNNIINVPPLSKFGIEPNFSFTNETRIDLEDCFAYTATNSYSFIKNPDFTSSTVKVISKIAVDLNEKDYL